MPAGRLTSVKASTPGPKVRRKRTHGLAARTKPSEESGRARYDPPLCQLAHPGKPGAIGVLARGPFLLLSGARLGQTDAGDPDIEVAVQQLRLKRGKLRIAQQFPPFGIHRPGDSLARRLLRRGVR